MSTLSILDAGREAPGRVALTDGRWQLTFAELAQRVAGRLRELSPLARADASGPSLVAVATDEQPATIETLLALIEMQRPFIPLHPRLTAAEREAMLEALPISWLLDPSGDALRLTPRPFATTPLAAQLLSGTPPLAALATSGSTGAPRVAVLSRQAFLASAAASAAHLGWEPEDRWLLCLPVAHIGGLSVLTRCLLARRGVAVLPRAPASSTERLAEAIRTARPTLISLVPTQLDALLALGPAFELPASVRVLLTGGAAASARLLGICADRGWPVLTSYGLTEACSQVATQRPGTTNRGELGAGVPLPGIDVQLDEGVIRIAGPTLASGYLGAGVEEVFRPELGFKTRDLGRFDAAGQLHVLGRLDDLIISGGENIAPWEVEAVLEGCDGVLSACVFGLSDPRWGEVVAAGLRTRTLDSEALVAAVERHVSVRLASFKRPRLYLCTTDFVYGKTGKLDRAATARELRLRLQATAAGAPSK